MSKLCLAILLLALGLRLYQLNADSLWEDEIFTATQSPLPVGELLDWTAGDIHPPGYYLIVGRLAGWLGWAHLPPSALTDWLWRFPSVLAGTLAVAVTYRLGADWLSHPAGLGGALLLALSPVAVQYSQEARMHACFLLGASLSTWTLGRALAKPRAWRWWLAYALATAFSLYTVYLGFVVLAAQGVLSWMVRRAWLECWKGGRVEGRESGRSENHLGDHPLIHPSTHPPIHPSSLPRPVPDPVPVLPSVAGPRTGAPGRAGIGKRRSRGGPVFQSSNLPAFSLWMLSVVLAFALYLPWWPTLVRIVARRLAVGGELGVGAPLEFLAKGISSLGPAPGWPAWLFLALWAVGLVSLVARGKTALALFGGLWVLLPLALPFVFRDPRALHVRYVFLLPVYLVCVALGMMALTGQRSGKQGIGESGNRGSGIRESGIRKTPSSDSLVPDSLIPESLIPRFLPIAAIIGLALISLEYLPGYYQRTKPDWRGASAYLAARTVPGDVIVTCPLFDVGRYLDYYYAGPAELLPPAALVSSLPDRMPSMRTSGGRVWALTRFRPAPLAAVQLVPFAGLTVSEPRVPIYEPDLLTAAMVDLMQQAVAAAPAWAADMSAQGVMDPDPLVARAAAYLFLGDVYRAAGRLPEAVTAYEAMVVDYPGSPGGYATLAEAYQARGQSEAAVRAYQRAIALNPAWQGPPAEAAASLAEAGHWAEAAAAYQGIIE